MIKIFRNINKLKNATRIAFIKSKYKSKFKSSFVQNFGHNASFLLDNDGEVELGRAITSRSIFNLIADGGSIKIGNGVFFNHNCSITALKGIEIGDKCSFGNNVVIVDHDHDFKGKSKSLFICEPVKIGNNVWVGANVVILKGTTIGDNSVIAAGTIVKGIIPDNTLCYQEKETILKTIVQAKP